MKNITNKQSKVYWENVILLAAFAAPKVFNFVFNQKKKVASSLLLHERISGDS